MLLKMACYNSGLHSAHCSTCLQGKISRVKNVSSDYACTHLLRHSLAVWAVAARYSWKARRHARYGSSSPSASSAVAARQSRPKTVCQGSSGCGFVRQGSMPCTDQAHATASTARKHRYLHRLHASLMLHMLPQAWVSSCTAMYVPTQQTGYTCHSTRQVNHNADPRHETSINTHFLASMAFKCHKMQLPAVSSGGSRRALWRGAHGLVAGADAGAQPQAVVVVRVHAALAGRAVVRAQPLEGPAALAPPPGDPRLLPPRA